MATYAGNSPILTAYSDDATSLHFSEDGSLVVVAGPDSTHGTRVSGYPLSTPWDVTTLDGSYNAANEIVVASELSNTSVWSAWFGRGGLSLYVAGPNEVNQYDLGTFVDHPIDWGVAEIPAGMGAPPTVETTSHYQLECQGGVLRLVGETHGLSG